MDEDEMQVKEWRNMLYYTINKVCEETSSVYGVSFTVNFIAALTELACRQIKHMAEDTEIFSRHGKRAIINSDDVKLLTRKSGALLDFIEEKISENARNKQKEKPSTSAPKKKKRNCARDDDDHEDLVI